MKIFRSYRDAGVDIDAGSRLVKRIAPLLRETFRPEVQTEVGGFASLFALDTNKYKNPVLVSGTDGVGTKLLIARMAQRYGTVGIDLVAMSVNDIITCGADPLFFLDTYSCGKLDTDVAVEVIRGVAEGCKQAGCALVGGETAEMPDFYQEGDFDIVGFAVGVVDRDRIIDGSDISAGDSVIGIAGSGLHSNGYSLVRKILFEQLGLSLDDRPEGFRGTVADELLVPTRIYAKTVQNLLRDLPVRGIVHITGGGLLENIPRVLPERCFVRLREGSWETPAIFDFIQKAGQIPLSEMYRTFNCGIGMVIICPKKEEENLLARLADLGERAWVIGEVATQEETRAPFVEMIQL